MKSSDRAEAAVAAASESSGGVALEVPVLLVKIAEQIDRAVADERGKLLSANPKLPISVLIAHKPSRWEFFRGFGLPSIERNNPAEILIDDGPGGGAAARNRLARRASQEFFFFANDDEIFHVNALAILLDALYEHPDCSWAYSDFYKITPPGVPSHGWQPVHPHVSGKFDPERLKKGNYIDLPSLIRRDSFLGFDEDPGVARLHDWDLWLRMSAKGYQGLYVPFVLYHSWNLDAGITTSQPYEVAHENVIRKNGIRYG